MSVHTKEPWRCSNRNWRDEEHPFHWFVTGGHAEEDGGGEYSVAVAIVVGNETAGDIPRDTARRIVAAVNACEGIPAAALEAGVVAKLRDRLAAAEAEVVRLRGALEPFARYSDHRDKAAADRRGAVPPDSFVVCGYAGGPGMAVITIGDCRRARAVLEAPTP
jgi:hypothetical protein